MMGEGSLGASFIPVYTEYLRKSAPRDAWVFAERVFWNFAIFLAVAAALGTIFSRQVIAIYTFLGGTTPAWSLATDLNRIIFPAIFFIGLAALAAAILNSLGAFAVPAASSVFFNLGLIVCSLGVVYRPLLRWIPMGFRGPAVALAVGVLLGGILQLGVQVPALIRRGMSFAPKFSFSDPGVRKVARLMGPSFFGMGVYQINIFVDTIFATSSRMPEGSVTSLYLGDRVMQLVLGSYAIALSTALLPAMSHQQAAGEGQQVKDTFGFSLRIVSFITIPAAVGLFLLRGPIIQVLFQHGQFTPASTSLTAHALLFYSLGLPAFAAIRIITPMYYSAQDTATPARVGAYALGLNVILNSMFLLFLFQALTNGGPALASSLTAYFNFGALYFLLRKRHGQLNGHVLLRSLARISVCAAAMGVACYAALGLSHFSAARHLTAQAGLLAAMILASTAAYLLLAWVFRCHELSELFSLLRRAKIPAASGGEIVG
jgi:putative peptidoglycan lipid II flippase